MALVENPYQAPIEAEFPETPGERQDLRQLARVATVSLRLSLLATAYVVVEHIYNTFIAARVGDPLHDGGGMTPSAIAAMVFTVVNWVSVILFLIWKYRAAANAHVLKPGAMSISPGMAVAGYFIPLVNFVLPGMAMVGIARASGVERFWAFMWWLCYVGLFVWMAALMFFSVEVEHPEMVNDHSAAAFLEHFLIFWSVINYFFSWQVMMRITRAQMTPEPLVEQAFPA